MGRRKPRKLELVDIETLVRENMVESIGLAFVPAMLEGVVDLPGAWETLIRAYQVGLIELRPDAGLGRYTQKELDTAPPGPQGSRLMWARLLSD